MKIEKRTVGLSAELWAAIDAARGDDPVGPFVENLLIRLAVIKTFAADDLKRREPDGRGKWERK